jgi:hypothetical protein
MVNGLVPQLEIGVTLKVDHVIGVEALYIVRLVDALVDGTFG